MIQIINLIFVGLATSILLNYSKYKNRKKLFIALTILFYIYIIPLISRFIYIYIGAWYILTYCVSYRC